MTTTVKGDRQIMPVDRMVGLIPTIPPDVTDAAARLVRASLTDPDAGLVLEALGLEASDG